MAISFEPKHIDITVNHETKVITLRANDPVMAARISKALSIPKAWSPK